MTKYGPLSDRAIAIRAIIQEACIDGGLTPLMRDMAQAMTDQGFESSEFLISGDIKRLVTAKQIMQIGKGPSRTYGIPNTILRTQRRPVPQRRFPLSDEGRASITAANAARLERVGGWPRPTAISIAAYDDAMTALPFAAGDMTSGDATIWQPKQFYLAAQSECGCAAAMCLE